MPGLLPSNLKLEEQNLGFPEDLAKERSLATCSRAGRGFVYRADLGTARPRGKGAKSLKPLFLRKTRTMPNDPLSTNADTDFRLGTWTRHSLLLVKWKRKKQDPCV